MQRFKNNLAYWLCYITAFACGMKQLREPDVWWQLLAGRWMLEHRQVTHTDVFSYTMAGHSWINVKWLYEILIALLEKPLGPLGVSLLQCVSNVLLIYFLQRSLNILRQRLQQSISPFFSVVAVVLFLMVAEIRMAGRPEMISHLLCVVYLFFLFRYPRWEWKYILWLVPLQCLWANMHEGYPVGLVMLGVFAAGKWIVYLTNRNKADLQPAIRAVVLVVLAALAVLINPNGLQLWRQPFEIYRQVWANKYTTELYSITQAAYWTIQAKIYIVLVVMVFMYWISRLRSDKTLLKDATIVSYLLLLVLFTYLSLTANRNIIFGAIILFPSVPGMLRSGCSFLRSMRIYKALQRQAVWVAAIVILLFYIAIVSNGWYRAQGSPNRYGLHISMRENPTGAAMFIQEHHIQGPAFSDYFISSYLLWSMYPSFKSYIDLRDLDVFPASFFDSYFKLYDHPGLFNQLDSQYHFNYVVVSTSQLIGLQRQLYFHPGFNMIYADPLAAIYLRESEANKPLNTNLKIQKLFTWPDAAPEPVWAPILNKVLNPFNGYDAEEASHAPVEAALFYKGLLDFPQAINILQPQMTNLQDDTIANRVMSELYHQYAHVTNDPALRQLREDSALQYEQQLGNLK